MAAVAMTTMDRRDAVHVMVLVSAGRGPMQLYRTKRKMKFGDVMIGQPFYACKRYWNRSDYEAASEIKGSTWIGAQVCSFEITDIVEEVESK
jgi:hypothetical protein